MTQLIELWETYLLQLDSDEDGPPLMPAGIRAADLGDPAKDGGDDDAQGAAGVEAAEGVVATAGEDAEEETRLSGTTARESEEVERDGGEEDEREGDA